MMQKIFSIYGCELRYHSLRVISTVSTLAGAVLIVMGTLLLGFGVSRLLSDATPSPGPGVEPFAVRQESIVPFPINPRTTFTLLCSSALLLSGLQTVAFGALARLAIQVEENTRASAQFLDKIRIRLESGEQDIESFLRS